MLDLPAEEVKRPGGRSLSSGQRGSRGDAASQPKSELLRTFFQPHHLRLSTARPYGADILLEDIRKGQLKDERIAKLRNGANEDRRYLVANGALLFKGRLIVPADDSIKLPILQSRHDHPTAGYQGIAQTKELVQRDFDWPGWGDYVETYVKECTTCLRTNAQRHLKYGKLIPLPIPKRPWSSISMNLIKPFPLSEVYNSILVIVCRLTKMAIFITTTTLLTAQGLAQIFLKHVFSKHGAPADIVSD